MTSSPGTDRDLLTQKAYATDEHLAIRQRIHETYSVPPINFTEWVLERVNWRGDEKTLDLGAGSGAFFGPIGQKAPHGTLVGADLSLGMMQAAKQKPGADLLLNADAQELPFANGYFDLVMANHVLFYVPDLDRALREIHRVLKPTGVLVAATNSQFTMPEFDQLFRRAFSLLGATGTEIEIGMSKSTAAFSLEDAPVKLSRHFQAVARYDLPSVLVFPTKQPVLEYFGSMRALKEPLLPRRVSWDDLMNVLSDHVQRLITHFGELVVNKLSGVVVATDSGGFASEYVERLRKSAR
jgi:SAM-dependent methyltransferase